MSHLYNRRGVEGFDANNVPDINAPQEEFSGLYTPSGGDAAWYQPVGYEAPATGSAVGYGPTYGAASRYYYYPPAQSGVTVAARRRPLLPQAERAERAARPDGGPPQRAAGAPSAAEAPPPPLVAVPGHYTPPADYWEVRNWRGANDWKVTLCTAGCQDPGACLCACCCPWCYAVRQRGQLLEGDSEYTCCAGLCCCGGGGAACCKSKPKCCSCSLCGSCCGSEGSCCGEDGFCGCLGGCCAGGGAEEGGEGGGGCCGCAHGQGGCCGFGGEEGCCSCSCCDGCCGDDEKQCCTGCCDGCCKSCGLCICLEVCCCLPCAIQANRFMIQKRYNVKTTCWDLSISEVACCCNILNHCLPVPWTQMVCSWLYMCPYCCYLAQHNAQIRKDDEPPPVEPPQEPQMT